MKQLVIAEKPSVARDLAKALGSFKKKDNYFERDDCIIASAVGHLVELYMPEDIDPKYKRWSIKNLPILPEKFSLKPIQASKKRFDELKKLIKRKDVGTVVNACDAGREGELIFALLCDLVGCKKEKKRLWLSSMTPSAIKSAFSDLKDDKEMLPLQDAARCRSESDWLIGINGTRAITGRMLGARRREVASVGRVQTPTLMLVYERELAIRNFKPKTFWKIKGNFNVHAGRYEGVLQKSNFKKDPNFAEDRADRLWEKADFDRILEDLNSKIDQLALVKESKKRSLQSPPKLYDLTALQREANQRFGFSAKQTLGVAQSLYEKHKALTYPRTDSRALPEDYVTVCTKVLNVLPEEYQKFAKTVLENQWVRKEKKVIFDNKKVSDHFAIIPTEQTPKNLSEQEQKLYDLVTKRFLAVFFPPAEFDVTKRLSIVDEYTFKTEGKVLVKPGWLEVEKKTLEVKDPLPAISQADGEPPKAKVEKISHTEDKTKPQPRFNEATLLASMERAGQFVEDDELAEAMKERGLGTPATRAQIIEHLIALKYLERQGRELLPTVKAEQLIEFIKTAKIELLTSPTLTGEWEYKLRLMQNGQLSRTQFMADIKKVTSSIVESIIAFQEQDHAKANTEILSPSDGQPMMETFRCFRSQDNKVCVYKIIGNRRMQQDEIISLIKDKKIGPLDGFKSKLGKDFSASLVLNDDYQIKFLFENSPIAESNFIENLENYPQLGSCPVCKEGKVFATEVSFLCNHHQDPEKKCKFRITRVLLNRQIPDDQFQKLIKDGKTDLLDKFKSRRTGKYFSAYLTLKPDGSIGFEFEKKIKKK